ncbi:ATP-dependent RecD-like DNA helicase [bioreactor metagenome]|uniref:ATP-dependent RecD-like DNA helicase n=1 Tax=bioreactor metagenome TaxID=1076179 RepID=A0A645HT16_9ZZZZ
MHKSQGNEFDAVIIPLLGRHKKLHYRNLLYTAVTRAKRLLILVGHADTVAAMVENNRKTLRYTNLASRILQQVEN